MYPIPYQKHIFRASLILCFGAEAERTGHGQHKEGPALEVHSGACVVIASWCRTEVEVTWGPLPDDFVMVALLGWDRLVAPPELGVRADDEAPGSVRAALHREYPAARDEHYAQVQLFQSCKTG